MYISKRENSLNIVFKKFFFLNIQNKEKEKLLRLDKGYQKKEEDVALVIEGKWGVGIENSPIL